MLEEFFREARRAKLQESVDALRADLDRWIVSYNTDRPHLGYRSQGGQPIEPINPYLGSVALDSAALGTSVHLI